jgi:hypothetical protein
MRYFALEISPLNVPRIDLAGLDFDQDSYRHQIIPGIPTRTALQLSKELIQGDVLANQKTKILK